MQFPLPNRQYKTISGIHFFRQSTCISNKTLAFDSPTGHQIQKGCSFCLIQIPCLCSIKTNSLFIPVKVGNCNNNTDTITILHPVNLALIQHFFSVDTYNSIMGDTTFTKPIDMTLPRIQMFNHSFSNFIKIKNYI